MEIEKSEPYTNEIFHEHARTSLNRAAVAIADSLQENPRCMSISIVICIDTSKEETSAQLMYFGAGPEAQQIFAMQQSTKKLREE